MDKELQLMEDIQRDEDGQLAVPSMVFEELEIDKDILKVVTVVLEEPKNFLPKDLSKCLPPGGENMVTNVPIQ